MCELQTALVIGRARYEGWLGTEPEEIAAAAEALRGCLETFGEGGWPGRGVIPDGCRSQSGEFQA